MPFFKLISKTFLTLNIFFIFLLSCSFQNTDFCASNVEWNFGKIWVDLFRYYAIEHPVEELVQIRVRQRFLSEHGTRWNKKRLAVEGFYIFQM